MSEAAVCAQMGRGKTPRVAAPPLRRPAAQAGPGTGPGSVAPRPRPGGTAWCLPLPGDALHALAAAPTDLSVQVLASWKFSVNKPWRLVFRTRSCSEEVGKSLGARTALIGAWRWEGGEVGSYAGQKWATQRRF